MKQIRRGVFETNSSSTHSICISKEPAKNLPSKVTFGMGEWGWSEGEETDTASYLYTAMIDNGRHGDLETLEEILKKHGVDCAFVPMTGGWYGIDHS